MIKYQIDFEGTPLKVSLASSAPNERAEIRCEGDEEATASFIEWLKNQTGAFGHLIGIATSPIDLDYALKRSPYPVTLIEGQGLIKTYDPEIPEGSIT